MTISWKLILYYSGYKYDKYLSNVDFELKSATYIFLSTCTNLLTQLTSLGRNSQRNEGSAKFPGQAISLKDATSQELFTATEQERNFQLRSSRNATIFHHPTLHNFNLPHLSVGANDSELEERILQHLAAATAMGRAHHFARRESQRTSSNKGHSPYMVFSPNSDIGPSGPVSGITSQRRREHERNPLVTGVSPSAPVLFPLRYLFQSIFLNQSR
ncbi:E3 ubiquitin-protein ligase RHF2A-like [Papaver somniferum]|uniref:E3 ubiquitin-protein ligase RHF2A-like n=1 Tax=Papaver somniferum TaxID=3469 RepID=UPI000E6FA236|nr:E3 ubiquitin-protein ligase RHF2A-like [Papaver somniferum]